MSSFAQPFLCHALELAIVAPSAVIALLPVRGLLRRKPMLVYVSAAILVLSFVALGSFICVYFQCPSTWLVFSYLPLMLAVYSYVVDLSMGKILYCFLFSALLGAIASVFTGFLMAPLEVNNPTITFTPLSSLVCLGVDVLLGAIFYRTLTVKIPMLLTEEDLSGSWYSTAFGVFMLTCLAIWVNPTDYSVLMEGRLRPIALIVVASCTLFLYVLMHVICQMAAHLVENTRLRQENSMLSMEERRYEQLKTYMDQTRTLRHDFRQHMRVIDSLVRADQGDELKSYVSELVGSTSNGHVQLCANAAVDAVASYYEGVAQGQETRIEWSLGIPETVFVKESDLCSVLGNLVENALQAVAVLPPEQRVVRVTAHLISEAMLGITVKNPYQGRIRLGRNGLPRVKQRDHGIGLASVQAIAKRYDGSFELSTKGGEFAVSILMYGNDSPTDRTAA